MIFTLNNWRYNLCNPIKSLRSFLGRGSEHFSRYRHRWNCGWRPWDTNKIYEWGCGWPLEWDCRIMGKPFIRDTMPDGDEVEFVCIGNAWVPTQRKADWSRVWEGSMERNQTRRFIDANKHPDPRAKGIEAARRYLGELQEDRYSLKNILAGTLRNHGKEIAKSVYGPTQDTIEYQRTAHASPVAPATAPTSQMGHPSGLTEEQYVRSMIGKIGAFASSPPLAPSHSELSSSLKDLDVLRSRIVEALSPKAGSTSTTTRTKRRKSGASKKRKSGG